MSQTTEVRLPAAFCARMKGLLGDDYEAFLASYDREPQRGLRVNTLKCTDAALLHALGAEDMRPIPYTDTGYYLDRADIGGSHPLHHAGAFYIQEPAAMLPVAAAVIRRGDFVLDVCAAPGGKSTQLAAMIGEDGLLVSNEYVPSRAKILLSNLERLGVTNAIITNTDAAHLGEWYAGCFDAVVVDAPCSGEGMFRKNETAVTEWSEENVAMCAARALGILSDACHCLREGGTLIYSTCTFAPEENERLIARFLSSHPDYHVVPLPQAVRDVTVPGLRIDGCAEDLSRCARCYPHVTGGEGQFVCVMRKDGDAMRAPIRGSALEKPTKAEAAAIAALMDELFAKDAAPNVIRYRGTFYAVPPQMAMSGVCFSAGVRIGEQKGSRLAPHHHLFSAYGRTMRRRWELAPDDERVLRYLHGETVEITDDDVCGEDGDGFGCVCVCGCPLGGAKRVGATLKNHYPKGLRIPKL